MTESAVIRDSVTDEYRDSTGTITIGGGTFTGDASDVPFVPAGSVAATDVQAAIVEVAAEAQPVDSDLSAIAALTTTAFGRGLLELANSAALLAAAGAAAAAHTHSGADITSGTVDEARIDAAIARDSEVSSAISALSSVYQPLDSDLTAVAALTTTSYGRAFLELADAAAAKTALALVKADVGLGNVDNTSDVNKPVSTAQQTALDGKVDENAGITGATKTKITYDAKGLVTAGADATTADIADSTNKRYVTDAQQTVLGNTSGTNTGDQTSVSGNAGTATALQTARAIDGQNFDGTAPITVIAPGTHAATGKTSPVDADELPLVDSAASNVLKKLTWANLKATLKTYMDTLYAGINSAVGGELAGTLPNPTVTANHGGEYVGGGGDVAINDTNYVTLATQNITFAAGDSVIVELDFLILNNSGGTRTYTIELAIGTFVIETIDGTTVAASATNRASCEFRGSAEIRASNLAYGTSRLKQQTPAAANTSATAVLLQDRMTWNTSASDFTGSQAVAVKIKSSATNATQTATVLAFRIRKA